MLDHIGINVSDFERSKAFYRAALAPLGYEIRKERPTAAIARASNPFAVLNEPQSASR
jgi:catechol 2,3-dioxygenase-like lactoylglutathione lyase family enzyme